MTKHINISHYCDNSKNPIKEFLAYVLIENNGETLTATATDSYRLAHIVYTDGLSLSIPTGLYHHKDYKDFCKTGDHARLAMLKSSLDPKVYPDYKQLALKEGQGGPSTSGITLDYNPAFLMDHIELSTILRYYMQATKPRAQAFTGKQHAELSEKKMLHYTDGTSTLLLMAQNR